MPDQTAAGSSEAADGGGYRGGSSGEPAPLQSRAHFLQNWDWVSVSQINHRLCERGRAQSGVNRETHETAAKDWEEKRSQELTLLKTFEFLKSRHRRAPFLFFNGNTFAEIGRALANALFSELPFHRKKELSSAAAHFITGVLDRESMTSSVETLCQSADFKPGDRVTTLRGPLHGLIIRIEQDGRIVWRPDAGGDITCLPESPIRET